MNYKFLLNLVAIPTFVGSIFAMTFMVNQVSAKEVTQSPSPVSCDLSETSSLKPSLSTQANGKTEILIASSDTSSLDFSSAESDAAATLFGCDCPSCINALRQLRSQPSLTQGKGHCWTALQEQVSSQSLQEVLNILEAEETK